ncbi:MAG TPA: YciI family protein [Nocardioides sp.]|uniref:YciI family protein n=1 Tax=Nocardioides sp. TaxID=35761 RepID=UPI002E37D772|nr:YciI family protein [Nocardioides sp.]HEX5087282.1 YciI family protein [Nocardioides sp.]
MKFLMLVTLDPSRDATDDDLTGTLDVEDWVAKYDSAGVRLMGNQVRMAADATSVTRRKGELLVTDGPYAESREWIVGFDVLECADLDEAIKVASEHPMAVGGRLELRPFVED